MAENVAGAKGRKRDRASSVSDALLPHANLSRVMRRSLRPKTMLSNQAVLAAQVWRSQYILRYL